MYEEVHRLENYSILSMELEGVDCAWSFLHGFLWKQGDGIGFKLFKMKSRTLILDISKLFLAMSSKDLN